ncbi:alpha-ketoglutarate-dependent dioxygenase AlkB [Pseudomonadota bacterium]
MLDPECFQYHAGFIPSDEADRCLSRIWKELAWRQQKIRLFGRWVLQPRLVAWYGEPEAVYAYSGLELKPNPWHPVLYDLKERIEAFTGRPFNATLANAYRDGSDSMGWHSDDEKELGPQPFIASISLGQERRFLVRIKGQKSEAIALQHGSLLIMKGHSQQNYQHCLTKTRKPAGVRINLTYRMIRGRTDSDRLYRTAG